MVVTASFGAQDTLHRPIGADPTRYKQDDVCFVAFVDKPTIEKFGYQSGCFDAWNVVGIHTRVPGQSNESEISESVVAISFSGE